MWASARQHNRSIAPLCCKKIALLHHVVPQKHINLFIVITTNFGHFKFKTNNLDYLKSENQVFNSPCNKKKLKNYHFYEILQ